MLKIQIQKSTLKSVKDHTLIIPLYQQGAKPELPKNGAFLRPVLDKLTKDKVFKADFKEVTYLRFIKTGQSQNVLFVGLGKKKDLTLSRLREALINTSAYLGKSKVPSFSFHLSSVAWSGKRSFSEVAQAATESLVLPLYKFTKFKKDEGSATQDQSSGIKSVTLVVDSPEEVLEGKKGLSKAKIFIDSCNLVRDLVNTPHNSMKATDLAQAAQDVAKAVGLKCTVFTEKELQKEGFGALLAVNQGSDIPPRFVILEHNAEKKNLDTVCLVGKGITFDSGGISLKPADSMETMKDDMAGSATVLGIMEIVAKLNLPLHVVGFMAITNNMPSGKATVPGDIVKSYLGKTIEILNTDAEGRLVLADAVAYADKHYKPSLLIDFATLTGACVIALGEAGAGVMGTAQKAIDRLKELSCLTGDKIWQLPLWEEYREELKSDIADIKNIGNTRGAGSSKGGMFIQAFIDDKTPWVHFDIAGSAFITRPTHRYYPKGATAACVRLVAEFLIQWPKAGEESVTELA